MLTRLIRYPHNAALVAALCFSSVTNAEWYAHDFNVMGTKARVELWAESAEFAHQMQQKVEADMRRIDMSMSPYKEQSDLSLINRQAFTHAVKTTPEIYSIIKTSLKYSAMTEGAFDITFSSVGYLYDYRQHKRPDKSAIAENLSGINFQHLVLNDQEHSIGFQSKGMRIDLGGIAKGHAVDNAIKILKTAGVTNAYVSAGGDSFALGDRKGRPWFIAIKHPRNANQVLLSIPLEDLAVSTSGDYERYFDEDGVRYHHIINPKTGDSARESQSVTILANDSITADALSTSVFILGPQKGLKLINSLPGVSAVIADKEGKVHYSDDLVDPKN